MSPHINYMVKREVTSTQAINWYENWAQKKKRHNLATGSFTSLCRCLCRYINVYVQQITELSTDKQRKTAVTSGPSLKATTYLPHLLHIFLLFPSLLFLSSFQRGRLTEPGSIQPEGTLSGRRSLTSCTTQGREYQLPILSYPASLKIHTVCLD